jgi:hypothetical protein
MDWTSAWLYESQEWRPGTRRKVGQRLEQPCFRHENSPDTILRSGATDKRRESGNSLTDDLHSPCILQAKRECPGLIGVE